MAWCDAGDQGRKRYDGYQVIAVRPATALQLDLDVLRVTLHDEYVPRGPRPAHGRAPELTRRPSFRRWSWTKPAACLRPK